MNSYQLFNERKMDAMYGFLSVKTSFVSLTCAIHHMQHVVKVQLVPSDQFPFRCLTSAFLPHAFSLQEHLILWPTLLFVVAAPLFDR